MELNLTRPLLFFDIESTGLNIATDGIIELSFVKAMPDGQVNIKTWKIKPWDYRNRRVIPIPAPASWSACARTSGRVLYARTESCGEALGVRTVTRSLHKYRYKPSWHGVGQRLGAVRCQRWSNRG